MNFEHAWWHVDRMSNRTDRHAVELEACLRENPDLVNQKNYINWSLLYYAAQTKNLEAVELLLKFGADPLSKDDYGTTPLNLACRFPNVRMLEAMSSQMDRRGVVLSENVWSDLLQHSVRDIYYPDKAIAQTRFLLDKGADPNYRNKDGETALFCACLPCAQLLLDHGADMEIRNNKGDTAFLDSMKRGGTVLGDFLLKKGTRIDGLDDQGRTMLHLASTDGDGGWTPIVRKLVKLGTDIDAKDSFGRTPFYYAAGSMFFGAVKALLKLGADINAKDNEGRTPLWAAETGPYLGTDPYYGPYSENEDDPDFGFEGDPVKYAKDRKRMGKLLREAGAVLE